LNHASPRRSKLFQTGSYVVETDEDLLEGLSMPAYRRTATYIVLPGPAGSSIASETFTIAPQELHDALSLDLEAALTKSARADAPELTLDDLLTDHLVHTTISSTPLALGEFKELMRELIAKRPDELASVVCGI
jgi:hypothetical protein